MAGSRRALSPVYVRNSVLCMVPSVTAHGQTPGELVLAEIESLRWRVKILGYPKFTPVEMKNLNRLDFTGVSKSSSSHRILPSH